MEKRPALGKGLSALIPDAPVAAPPRAPLELDVDQLEPSEFQPRHHIDEARLDGLAASIRANGVVQPVVVRRIGADRYQIIAGERRWRAAQRAGLTRVPVVVKDVPPGGRTFSCSSGRWSRTCSARISTRSRKPPPTSGWPPSSTSPTTRSPRASARIDRPSPTRCGC